MEKFIGWKDTIIKALNSEDSLCTELEGIAKSKVHLRPDFGAHP